MGEWINIIILGALLGAAGQAARGIVGLKKVYDEAQTTHLSATEIFRPSRLVVSLIVGAVAGMLAAVMLVDDPAKYAASSPSDAKEFMLALVAIGYAGTDFIEGFVRNRYSPAALPVTSPAAPATPVAASPATSGRPTSSTASREPDDDLDEPAISSMSAGRPWG